ncbi:hypothetical protein IFM89_021215 [Coptis chinensis]|uniref:Uncharacterized protein n=1 Tax=Coptis chinensis TaxID=261450 RepID=A0A835LJB6_9MAGN|nr:hypothetical protein IFM89_021215 [Coptis chinensis]
MKLALDTHVAYGCIEHLSMKVFWKTEVQTPYDKRHVGEIISCLGKLPRPQLFDIRERHVVERNPRLVHSALVYVSPPWRSQPMQPANPIVVIGPQYFRYITPVPGNTIFTIRGIVRVKANATHPGHNVLLDANGSPLVGLREKFFSAHNRYNAYSGNSSKDKHYLFSVKASAMYDRSHAHEVFLASNTQEKVCDFNIRGSWMTNCCSVYLGDSSNVIARMQKNHNADGEVPGKGTYTVTVYPYVDHAFIFAVLAYLHESNLRRGY